MNQRSASCLTPSHRLNFETVVKENRAGVRSFLLRLTGGDHHTTDDLCQEVFLRAYETYHTLIRKKSLRSWLFSIGYHATVDWIRKRSTSMKMLRNLERVGKMSRGVESPEIIMI